MAWKDAQFVQFVEDSIDLLKKAQIDLEHNFGLGRFERWDLDQDREQLIFSDDTGLVISCGVYALGTIGGDYWKWAWTNSSLLEGLSTRSRGMQKLGPISGM